MSADLLRHALLNRLLCLVSSALHLIASSLHVLGDGSRIHLAGCSRDIWRPADAFTTSVDVIRT